MLQSNPLSCPRSSLLVLALLLGFGGCKAKPVIPFSLDEPARMSAPLASTDVQDGRARYRELFHERMAANADPNADPPTDPAADAEHYLHRWEDERAVTASDRGTPIPVSQMQVLIVPGFVGDATPQGIEVLQRSVIAAREQGYRIDYARVSGGGSSKFNGDQIAEKVRSMALAPSDRLVIVGYSKGAPDALRCVVDHPDVAQRVSAIVSLAGAINGSILAQGDSEALVDIALAIGDGDRGDGGGLNSLRPHVRLRWLAQNPLPQHIKYFSLASFTTRDNVSSIIQGGYDTMAQVDPRNDSQVFFFDQIIPGSTVMGYHNCDHWALCLPFIEETPAFANTLVTRNVFPRQAMLEAVLLYVRENL